MEIIFFTFYSAGMVTFIKVLKILTVLSFLLIALVAIAMLAEPFVIQPLNTLVNRNRNPNSQFDNYTTSVQPSANTFYVQYKDVQGTGRQEIGESKPMYYSMDVTIETANKNIVQAIQANNAAVVNIMREALANTRGLDMNNEEGRNYVKQQIKRRLSDVYGEVDDIYIEKFLYE